MPQQTFFLKGLCEPSSSRTDRKSDDDELSVAPLTLPLYSLPY